MSLVDHFLIATPQIHDDLFHQSVIYVCQDDAEGTMGLVINRPMLDAKLGDMLNNLNIDAGNIQVEDQIILAGGPVKLDHGFILHRPAGQWQTSFTITPHMAVTTSQDILLAMTKNQGPSKNLITLGCAFWEPGQLQEELMDFAWLTWPADDEILFETHVQHRWQRAIKRTGIKNLCQLSPQVGHA